MTLHVIDIVMNAISDFNSIVCPGIISNLCDPFSDTGTLLLSLSFLKAQTYSTYWLKHQNEPVAASRSL